VGSSRAVRRREQCGSTHDGGQPGGLRTAVLNEEADVDGGHGVNSMARLGDAVGATGGGLGRRSTAGGGAKGAGVETRRWAWCSGRRGVEGKAGLVRTPLNGVSGAPSEGFGRTRGEKRERERERAPRKRI
jgi:hypothetical protein